MNARAVAMKETPCFFLNGNYRLFGMVHVPTVPATGCGWVFCHPFVEEKLWAHRVYVSFARRLAAAGAWVVRFDAMGNGDSEGTFPDSSVESMLSDVGAAINLLEESADRNLSVGLLGLRLGATVAALAAEQRPDVRRLVAWEPIVDGARYMQELLRVNLTTQTAVYKEIRHNREELVRMMKAGQTVNVDGYELTQTLFEQISAINLGNADRSFVGPCLIVQMGKEGQPIRPELKALQLRYPHAELRHATEEPFWREIKRWYGSAPNLDAVTLSWLAGGGM